ncbi:MAG: M48 family metallopeptidase [Rhodospirillaceae bacterium]|jgi:predicted Zn-dependent protease|nr:M48 family metallopeptidase [Rhodospirillaceae bacterium]MBT5191427.1 M48 family metallopeptidase [Rhodospirillaceae bacterium]MBT5895074.1 M48 family metallopeptidase [Rhodospirillaceae bacterium]MBT6427787.1 M48 family metallopeptidase [Rhodospirillaceae bacterium]
MTLLVGTEPAQARRVSFIRDAEIEDTIRLFGTPLFAVAGLEPSAVRVFLVKDSSLNAFVAGGQKIFINTGLLIASDDANQVIGVMAHETGHITGGHLARTQDALRDATAQSIMAFVLGAAAAVAGQGQAGSAIIAGGTHVAQRSFLKYSRVQESSADQAALSILEQTGQSARGMLAFFDKLGDQEALLTSSQDPYVRTHPLTRNRVDTIRAAVARSPYSDAAERPEFVIRHHRMQAKLIAFLRSPAETFRKYPNTDKSLYSRYARSIAQHKKRQTAKALELIQGLLTDHPDDPYFHEFHGQILLENGRAAAAVAPYQRAVDLRPNSVLLRIGLGQAQVSAESDQHIEAAVENMRRAVRLAPGNPSAWRWLGMAHGRHGDLGQAALATAERYFLTGKFRDAAGQAARAERTLAKGSPGWLRAQDIKAAAQRAGKRKKR